MQVGKTFHEVLRNKLVAIDFVIYLKIRKPICRYLMRSQGFWFSELTVNLQLVSALVGALGVSSFHPPLAIAIFYAYFLPNFVSAFF